MRLDNYLVEKGYFDSRTKAKQAIERGEIFANKVKITKCEPLFGEDYFEWTYYPLPEQLPNYKYTSRGVGLKFSSGSDFLVTALQAHIMSVYDENYNQIF